MRSALLAWYAVHRRDLPWRRTRDPYRIWVSEVMLQQTRVAAAIEHYQQFIKAFPDVGALAAAAEAEVLAIWSGLGYYRRARMLHQAARVVVADHGGAVPETAAKLLTLPGVGGYTAAAVASIAFGEALAVVDGNVQRVLARVAGWSAGERGFDSRVRNLADQLLESMHPGDYNQAIMELGATVCLPRAPLCLACPWQPWCATRGEHPMPARPAAKVERSARAVWMRRAGLRQELLLVQRPATASLMAGMWELPFHTPAAQESIAFTLRHAITVTNHTVDIYTPRVGYKMRSVTADAQENGAQTGVSPEQTTAWVAIADLPRYALTGLTRKALARLGLLPSRATEPQATSSGVGPDAAVAK